MQSIPAALTLVDGAETIVIRPERASAGDPIVCKQWDLGAPEVRTSSAERALSDGAIDRSGYTGSRTVTFELQIFGDVNNSAYAYAERLIAMTHPYRRPVLQARRATPEAYGQTWSMELRGNPYSISYGRRAAALLELQLSFTAPLGYLEGDYQGYETNPSTAVETPGIVFPLTFPITTGSTTYAPAVSLIVSGSAPIHPLIYIYGPCTNPEVRSGDGERFKFAGLVLTDGQFVVIDMGGGTARLGGNIDASLFHLVDWTVSSFWRWSPGPHTVTLSNLTGRIAVYWRDRRFTI